jgi:WD40 repeat protein
MDFEDIICDKCQLILESPVTLPCGNTLCKVHLEGFNEKFKCSFCDREHLIDDQDGFAINKKMIKIINNYINFDRLRKETIESLNNLNELINEYESINPDDFVYEYFRDLRNKVDLHREELKKEVDDKSDELIEQLNEKEQKCKSNFTKLKKIDLKKLKNHMPQWRQNLRTANIDQNKLNDLLSKLIEHSNNIKDDCKIYKRKLIRNESFEFEKFENINLFGKLVIKRHSLVLSRNSGDLKMIFNQHSNRINSIQVNENLEKIITASDDKTIKIWNPKTGQCLITLEDHTSYINCILMISNNRFVSGSDDKTIRIWDSNSYKCLNIIKKSKRVYSLCLTSNENEIACGCQDGNIDIMNLENLTLVRSVKAHDSGIEFLSSVDNNKLISCSTQADPKIKIWNLETFECIKVLEGHLNTIYYLELTSNVNLFSCSEDKTVKLWNIETGELLNSIQFKYPVNCIQLLNDDIIAAALENGEIELYNLKKKQKIKSFLAHLSYVYRMHFLSNGYLLSGCGNGEIHLRKMLE